MTTYLYRAVTTVESTDIRFDEEDTDPVEAVGPHVLPAGTPIGRRSGYLSRSAAIEAAHRYEYRDDEFEIVRSEPVIFLTRRERLEREIDRLRAELAATI